MKGREEKGKKRVIHLYAGKDNQLAIWKRREEQEAGDPPVRRKGQPTRYLDEVDIQRRRDEVKRREEQEAGDPPVRRKGQQTRYLAEEQEAGDPPVRGKGQQTCYLAEVDNQKRREEKMECGVIHR